MPLFSLSMSAAFISIPLFQLSKNHLLLFSDWCIASHDSLWRRVASTTINWLVASLLKW